MKSYKTFANAVFITPGRYTDIYFELWKHVVIMLSLTGKSERKYKTQKVLQYTQLIHIHLICKTGSAQHFYISLTLFFSQKYSHHPTKSGALDESRRHIS